MKMPNAKRSVKVVTKHKNMHRQIPSAQCNKELDTRAAEAEATANEQAKKLAQVTTALDVANVATTKANEEAASVAMQRNIAAGLFVIALIFAFMSRRGTA